MGREARASKWRKCPFCQVELPQDAEELREHAKTCERMVAIGLVTGGIIEKPTGLILTEDQ